MNPILEEFYLDLEKLRRILQLSKSLNLFLSCNSDLSLINDENLKNFVTDIQLAVRHSHSEMPILNGVLILYLAGRFENYVKDIFEELCDTVAANCTSFSNLPSQMRTSLIKYTADVIANPRKYGHAENGVIAFVSTLADNLKGITTTGVNSKCISITSENMWPDTLTDMFSRIGANKLWERLGQQALIQRFFELDQPEKATKEAQAFLKKFMELRNQIAHPSGTINWPSMDQTFKYIKFCEVLATALTEISGVLALTLGTRATETPTNADGNA